MVSVALTIAGSDPSGGAGIQADLKTFHRFSVYGAAAITLITVQNTLNVTGVQMLPEALVGAQVQAVLDDLPVAAIKTGALGNAEIIQKVARTVAGTNIPLIVDPVMISKHGAPLLAPEAQQSMREVLVPLAYLVTPNIPEAEALTGRTIQSDIDIIDAANDLLAMGAHSVLIKGGHRDGPPNDYFAGRHAAEWMPGQRVATRHTHGTGCTYSAAITALVASGQELTSAIRTAKPFIQHAIETAPGLGSGHGPLNHWAD